MDNEFSKLLRTPGMDQAEMSAKDLAQVLGTFRKELLIHGFANSEMWELCREFFLAMLDREPAEDE